MTEIETRDTGVTVRIVEPEILPELATIVVDPAARAVANPFDPAVSPMVAMALSDEVQTTDVVMSCVVLSVKVPSAVNC